MRAVKKGRRRPVNGARCPGDPRRPSELRDKLCGADDRCREDRKRKAPPPIVEEEIIAEGYVCETCGSTRVTCATESRPTTSYGTSEFRQILFLDCLDCGRSWQED